MDPEMSHSATSAGQRVRRAFRATSDNSPPRFIDWRIVRRQSGRAPWMSGAVRRLFRGGTQGSAAR